MKSVLDATYERYERSLIVVPLDLQQDLHLYMCVRLSGYLEQLLHQAITAYVLNSSSPAAGNFATSYFRHAPNLNPESLEKLIAKLGDDWRDDLREFLDTGENRGSLGTLLRIRNDTAHGKSYAGRLANVKSYKILVDDVHRWIHGRTIDVSGAPR